VGAPSPGDRSRHQVEIVDHDMGVASHHYSAEELQAGGADDVIESLTEGLPL
jgi:hypothetical protein